MGAWGTGIFENDTAADWAGEFDASEDPNGFVRATLTDVNADADYAEVLAAAAMVATGLPGGPRLEETYGPKTRPLLDSALVPLALAAVDEVAADDSEWAGLWREAGELGEARQPWHRSVPH